MPVAWLTVNVCPATVIVPTRDAPEELDGIVKVNVPLPLPVFPLVTVIQLVSLTIEKSQFDGAVISKE